MAGHNPNFMAAGNILPSIFVTQYTSGDNRVIAATLNSRISGVSGEDTRQVPIPSASTYHAISGDPVRVYGDGEQCLLKYGDSITRGARIKSDANGAGITIGTTGIAQNQGAIALESGEVNELHNVLVQPQLMPASAS
jgi:hypothetical protein